MKKVLWITYFWPPSGKATLHWPLKIIKHLPQFNWEPTILTVKDEKFTQKDLSLLKEVDPNLKVVKSKAFEPFDLYRKFTGKSKDENLIASETISKSNKNLTHKISIWIRMNLFVPDARVGWYLSGVNKGLEILENEKFDAIVTIGPPHSTHLIGFRLSKKTKLPHIPILIDPWVDIIYYKEFKRSKPTLALDNYFERKVLSNASQVVFVTETTKKDFTKKYEFLKEKSHVLYWGYNEDSFKGISKQKSENEVLVHAGNIFDYQNPKEFWKTLKIELNQGRKLKIKFIGTVGPKIKESVAQNGLANITEYLGFLPFKEMIQEIVNASYLLVCASEPRHVPGKLFEYLRTGNPIIAFGDENREVKRILEETSAGMIFHYNESAKEFFNKSQNYKTNIELVKNFDREKIAKDFSIIL